MKTQYRRKLIDSVEEVVGDIIDELIDKYYGDYIESDYDYDRLLYAIARIVKREVFGNKATPEDIINYLVKLRAKKGVARLVLSYLISRALEENMASIDLQA